jgi:hypothetical protein
MMLSIPRVIMRKRKKEKVMSKRIRLIDRPSVKRYVIETKKSWLKPWEQENYFEYKYTQKFTALTEANTYIENMLQEDVVLFDSKENKNCQ